MAYETSYDASLKPFNHDPSRGKWSSPRDFFYACIGHAFKIDAVFVMPSVIFRELGIYGLIPYFLVLGTCVIPIVFMQSFLGQFSSTGFISVFRIAPLFKGIGFVSLTINLITLTYYSVFAGIPLLYFLHSLRPVLPWSCEGAEKWMEQNENTTSACDGISEVNETAREYYSTIKVPSLEFLKVHLNLKDNESTTVTEPYFSWSLVVCTLIVWLMVSAVLTRKLEVIARFIRYSFLGVAGIMCLCLARFACLPGALAGLQALFEPSPMIYGDMWMGVPLMALSALGPGWGSILVMASLNKFKTNIFRFSWLLCFAQFCVMFGLALLGVFVSSFIHKDEPIYRHFQFLHSQWMEFLTAPTALTFIEMPHIWTLLFFSMMILGTVNLLIVQLLSVLTSLFDEYEKLSPIKTQVTLVIVGLLALTSTFFCSNIGVEFFDILTRFSIVTQMFLNLLLLLVVLWVYGRERFQRDVNFMTNRIYSTWMVNVVRFVAPIFLLITLLLGLVVISETLGRPSIALTLMGAGITLLPWCLIPGYCIFKLMQTSGKLGERFKRSVRPTDWYPVDAFDRRRYEQNFSSSDISHQLTTMSGEQI